MRELEIGKPYRHFKGNFYLVLDIASHSETSEKYVVYKQLYGACKTYIRPLEMFLEEIDINRPDNKFKQKYRFERKEIEC